MTIVELMKRMPCRECGGDGQTAEYIGYDRAADPPTPLYRNERCFRCGGTGDEPQE